MPRQSDGVTIVGFGPSADAIVPYAEGPVWCLAHDPFYTANATQLFEMHDMDCCVDYWGEGYRDRLKNLAEFVPIYTTRHEPWLPNSQVYPLEEVIEKTLGGIDYFQSSIAYMFALAIHQGYREITVAGVDLVSADYKSQRCNLEWMVGLAQGRGIDVLIPDWSELLRYNDEPLVPKGNGLHQRPTYFPKRYGYDMQYVDATTHSAPKGDTVEVER